MRLLLTFLAVLLPSLALPCGDDRRCEVGGGYYLAAKPDDWDRRTPLPVVVYFHGWKGTTNSAPRRVTPCTIARFRNVPSGEPCHPWK